MVTNHNLLFMQSEAAQILDLPKSQLENWVSGRTLYVHRSVVAHGSGSRNMFNESDLCRLAIAAQMSSDRVRMDVIQALLNRIEQVGEIAFAVVKSGVPKRASWKRSAKSTVEIIRKTGNLEHDFNATRRHVEHSYSCYLVNVSFIVEVVTGLTAAFLKKSASTSIEPEEADLSNVYLTRLRRRFNIVAQGAPPQGLMEEDSGASREKRTSKVKRQFNLTPDFPESKASSNMAPEKPVVRRIKRKFNLTAE